MELVPVEEGPQSEMVFYRYYEQAYSTMIGTIYIKVHEEKFDMVKETECGYWIQTGFVFPRKKWVSKTAKKRFAYPTKKEALDSFIKRKERQKEILEHKLSNVKEALSEGHRMIKEMENG